MFQETTGYKVEADLEEESDYSEPEDDSPEIQIKVDEDEEDPSEEETIV